MLTAVILAAGEAERMGELKQLLEWKNGNTILGKSLDNILEAGIVDEEIIIVLGAEKERIKKYLRENYFKEINSGIIRVLENDNYQQGMMSSVKIALNALLEKNEYILFTLADKPFIKAEIYQEFYQEFLAKKPAVFLPEFKEQQGHPVIIKNELKEKALKLEGEEGLRKLFALIPEKIYHYPSKNKEITVDIDYQEDYKNYRDKNFRIRSEQN